MLLNIVIKPEQILLDLKLLAYFNRELHALLHLVQPLLLFHVLVDLNRVAFLLLLYLLFNNCCILHFLMGEDLGSAT